MQCQHGADNVPCRCKSLTFLCNSPQPGQLGTHHQTPWQSSHRPTSRPSWTQSHHTPAPRSPYTAVRCLLHQQAPSQQQQSWHELVPSLVCMEECSTVAATHASKIECAGKSSAQVLRECCSTSGPGEHSQVLKACLLTYGKVCR